MTAITVWAFDKPDHAKMALKRIEGAASQGLVKVEDAAIVSWPEGSKRPKTRQLHSMAGAGAVGGAFWGMLFGLLFFAPFLGAAIGAAAGGGAGALADVGIDDEFIDNVKAKVLPGTSALFLMSSGAVIDKLKDTFEGMQPELVQTSLTSEQESELKEWFHLV